MSIKIVFGFMPGHGTADVIFIVRQLEGKCLAKKKKKKKNQYQAFVDVRQLEGKCLAKKKKKSVPSVC